MYVLPFIFTLVHFKITKISAQSKRVLYPRNRSIHFYFNAFSVQDELCFRKMIVKIIIKRYFLMKHKYQNIYPIHLYQYIGIDFRPWVNFYPCESFTINNYLQKSSIIFTPSRVWSKSIVEEILLNILLTVLLNI